MDNDLILRVMCPEMRSPLKHNGPAIKGGCGTWRSPSVTYPGTLAVIYPGGKTGMACFLQIQVQVLLRDGAIAV